MGFPQASFTTGTTGAVAAATQAIVDPPFGGITAGDSLLKIIV
jgi:hypothetical protein